MKDIGDSDDPELEERREALDAMSDMANMAAASMRQRLGLNMALVVIGVRPGGRDGPSATGMSFAVGGSVDPRDLPDCGHAIATSLRHYADQLSPPDAPQPERDRHHVYDRAAYKRRKRAN